MTAGSVSLGVYRNLYVGNQDAESIRAILDISKTVSRSNRASPPLKNRQSGGGQSTGIDVLCVRGSVQGRF